MHTHQLRSECMNWSDIKNNYLQNNPKIEHSYTKVCHPVFPDLI